MDSSGSGSEDLTDEEGEGEEEMMCDDGEPGNSRHSSRREDDQRATLHAFIFGYDPPSRAADEKQHG